MRERLGKIAKLFAAQSKFFRKQSDVIGIAESFFENEPRLLHVAGPSETLHVPKRAHAKRPFRSRQTVLGAFEYLISVDQRILQ